MTSASVTPNILTQPTRYGVNQAGRVLPALDPAYVAVDERSLPDLLRFAGAYAKELRYFDLRQGAVQAVGDWRAFLGSDDGDMNVEDLAAFLQDPASLPPAQSARYRQPHLVLFLTFLDLLQQTRGQLNHFTRRHLEFYYRTVLGLTPKAAQPDHLHVLVDLADEQAQVRLPAGTLLAAGQDAHGRDRFYCTEQESLLNRAQVASLKSLFVQKQIFDLRAALDDPTRIRRLLPNSAEVPADPFLLMLRLTLGQPNPGDPLPDYLGEAGSIDEDLLGKLDKLLSFIDKDLALTLPAFRTLMTLQQEQTQRGKKWEQVNDTLTEIAKNQDPPVANVIIDRASQDFESNLKAALGLENFNDFFDTLPAVNDIYDLYRLRDQEPVKAFIETQLKIELIDFSTMMEIVNDIDTDWRQIYAILRAAARKKNRPIPQPFDLRANRATNFGAMLAHTLGVKDDLASRYAALLKLENYFYMTAEEFAFLRAQLRTPDSRAAITPQARAQIIAILEKAHQNQQIAARCEALKEKHISFDQNDQQKSVSALVRFALGDPAPGDELPDNREFLALNPDQDASYIQEQLYLALENFRYIQETAAAKPPKPITDKAWTPVYQQLEAAQRRKRGILLSRPQLESWENLYSADDATQVQVQRDLPEEQVTPRWRTFGAGYGSASAPATIGFAVASPLLALAEGQRTITLDLTLRVGSFDPTTIIDVLKQKPFRCWLTTAQKLVEVTPSALTLTERVLAVSFTLDPQAPPIAPLAAEAGLGTDWPVLYLHLADLTDADDTTGPQPPRKRYRALQPLVVEQAALRVQVSNLTQLTLQNDDGLLNAKKPVDPFGLAPVTGNNFAFAHPEIGAKALDELTLQLEWLGAPAKFSGYYNGYQDYENPETKPTSPITDNTSLKANLKLYDHRAVYDMGQIALFDATDATKPHTITITGGQIRKVDAAYTTNPTLVTAADVLDWNRYWLLELGQQDFQHAVYPYAAAGCARKTKDEDRLIIKPPYTPKLKRLTLGYSATATLDLVKHDPTAALKLYHLEPFGYRELTGNANEALSLLPQFTNEGELFIGLTALMPPQRLALLFQVAEGSADPALPPTPVQWWVLSGNEWITLEQGHLLADATNGLRDTGIITFDLPTVAPSTRLPPTCYWLRATIAHHSRSVSDLVAIHTQAVRAVFVVQDNAATDNTADNTPADTSADNAPAALYQPLPPATITRLAETGSPPGAAVKAIRQPYSSSGGRGAEQAGHFYTRVSERLRHKNRALTSWDYERLVLEAFPSIYKVKCLPVGISDDPALADQLQIIVVPDIRGKLPFDPFEPKASTATLAAITDYLQEHSPPFARVVVKNPTYIRLRVRLGVRFRPGYNPGWASATLQQALQRYLAPWAYDQSAELVFGGTINGNLIVNFVERLPYVEYVAGITLFPQQEGSDRQKAMDATYTVPPDAILVSDRQHTIDTIGGEVFQAEFFTGINYMQIELDFEIA